MSPNTPGREVIERQLCVLIAQWFNIERSTLTRDSRYDVDFGDDSLDQAEFFLAIEERFNVVFEQKTTSPAQKAVFDRWPWSIADIAELICLMRTRL